MFNEVKEIILEQLDLDEKEIKVESELMDELGADSLDVLEIMSAVETKFDVEFKKEEVEKVETINDILVLLDKKLKEAGK